MKKDMLFVKEQSSTYIYEKGLEISKEIAIRLSDPKFVFDSVHTLDNVMTETDHFPWGTFLCLTATRAIFTFYRYGVESMNL